MSSSLGGQAEKEKMKTKQEKLKEKVKREKKEKVKAKGKEGPRARPSCRADKTLATQKRLEEQQRQQAILEEMKKPTEDMCLSDHQVLRVMEGPVLRTFLVLPEGLVNSRQCLL